MHVMYNLNMDYSRSFAPGWPPARIAGMIIGHAFGDAIGLQSEFSSAQPTWPYSEPVRGVPLHDWTDDTDLLAVIVMSMCDNNSNIIPKDIADRYRTYMQRGLAYFDDNAPTTPNGALRALVNMPDYVSDPFGCAGLQTASSGGKHAIGCATARMCIAGATKDPPGVAEALTLMTNPDPRCVAAGIFIACVCNGLIFDPGLPIEQTMEIALEEAKKPLVQAGASTDELMEWYQRGCGKLSNLELGQLGKATYVFKAFATCVWCCRIIAVAQKYKRTIDAKACLLKIAGEGGDADTNASCAGAILGAYIGVHGWSEDDVKLMPNYLKLSGIAARWVSCMFRPTTKEENATASASATSDQLSQCSNQDQNPPDTPAPSEQPVDSSQAALALEQPQSTGEA